ncbi:rRNA maturation RNase YbeY [Rhodospirillales bacterium]|nr:rRNA maturation RNase YbeY [Rhodospirillales bacterium]
MTVSVHTVVQLRSKEWRNVVPNFRALCSAASNATWQRIKTINGPCELSIVLANDEFIRKLNKKFRGENRPTNVLSFPAATDKVNMGGDIPSLGDIVLALETVIAEAHENLSQHFSHLIVHGCLHLVGHDHLEEAEAVKMEALEVEILKTLNIKNPYV